MFVIVNIKLKVLFDFTIYDKTFGEIILELIPMFKIRCQETIL